MAKRKKKKYIKIIPFFTLFLLVVTLGCALRSFKLEEDKPNLFLTNKQKEERKKEQEELYNVCLNREFQEEELTENLLAMQNNISSYIRENQYQVSVFYEDLITGFTYSYNPSTVYYGCSLIKLVDAIYLINKAIEGKINLDTETVIYTEEYVKPYSSGMAKRKFGEKVTLRDLITYAISVSDNSAHLMLLDYIGFSNLKEYGQNLGAKVILTGGDNFGNQTAEDMNIYLKEAYRIMNENEEYGTFLKSIMDNNERNAFNTDTIKIYHKYGSYGDNYHDVGLSLENYPYAISILTLHENSGYKEIIQDIHERVRVLQHAFYENRKSICSTEVW